MAQWSVKLPALLALIATQVGLLASQVSSSLLQRKVLSVDCHTFHVSSIYVQPTLVLGMQLTVVGMVIVGWPMTLRSCL